MVARALIAFAGITLALAVARGASAQPDDKVARADRLFHEGEKLFDAKRTAEACASFAESNSLDPRLGTLLNLAFCHEALGKNAMAWAEYNEAAAWAAQRKDGERAAFARKRSAELARKLARVLLELPRDQDIGAIEVDGEPLPKSRWSTPIFFDPGDHMLRVSAPGKRPRDIAVHAEASQAQTIRVAPLDDTDAPPTPQPPPVVTPMPATTSPPPANVEVPGAQDARRTRTTYAIVLGSVGVVGLGVGSYFGLRAISKKGTANDHCAGGVYCDDTGYQAQSDAHHAATIANVAFAVGVVGVGVAAALVLIPSSSPAASTARARVAPMAGPGTGGVMLEGRW